MAAEWVRFQKAGPDYAIAEVNWTSDLIYA
jgi:hypothetical protein